MKRRNSDGQKEKVEMIRYGIRGGDKIFTEPRSAYEKRWENVDQFARMRKHLGRKRKRISGKTRVVVGERGKTVTKSIEDCLPPKSWFERTSKYIKAKSDVTDSDAVAANRWWTLNPKKKLEIMRAEGKFKRFPKSARYV
jgi:hypothetical protein